MIRSRKHEQHFTSSVAADGNRTTTQTGAAADTLGYGSATAIVNPNTVTDGVFTPKLQESDASGSGFTDVAAGDLDGAFVAIAASVVQTVGYTGSKRYVRIVITATGSPATGAKFAAGVLLGDPQYAPTI
jgi:hypothetical protein